MVDWHTPEDCTVTGAADVCTRPEEQKNDRLKIAFRSVSASSFRDWPEKEDEDSQPSFQTIAQLSTNSTTCRIGN